MNTDIALTSPDAIAEGQQAWARIKTASKMMREDWRAVGEALLVGRNLFTTATGGLNKKGFGQWCRDNGFEDIPSDTRSNALWLTENWNNLERLQISQDICHPKNIREAYNTALAGTSELEDDDEGDTPPRCTR